MKRFPYLTLILLIVVSLFLGALQGYRVRNLREADAFYRWLVTASTQLRVFGTITPELEGEEAETFMDRQLFDRVVEEAEKSLPDIDVTEDDIDDATGEPYPKLVRYTRTLSTGALAEAEEQEGEKGKAVNKASPEQVKRDTQVWRLARSEALADERADFTRFLRDNRLATAGTQIGVADIYRNKETPVSIGQMFLGFRKLAAGLVWMQVDEAFHKGEMQRMIPLMRTTVLLDPNFVDAYLIGAWHLAYNLTAQMSETPGYLKEYVPEFGEWVGNKERAYYAAVNFLKDGIRNNPRDYRLYFDLGYAIYDEKLDDPMNAVTYLTEATKQRHESWVRRMLYHNLQANGQFEEARAGWEDYLRANPGHAVAQRMIPINTALIKERDAAEAGRKAEELRRQAGRARADGEEARAKQLEREAEALEEQQEALQAEARDIYTELNATLAGGDEFAQARLWRMRAIKLHEEGRTLEALALLRQARMEVSTFFEEASEMIIEMCQEAGLPLNLSERKWLREIEHMRKTRAENPLQFAGRTFQYNPAEDIWRQQDYANQQTTVLLPASKTLASLRKERPIIDQFIGLGKHVVFELDGQWYEFVKTTGVETF
jgi:tetratricopeptide (TPR) repeat protein